jgi:hypothetical protein
MSHLASLQKLGFFAVFYALIFFCSSVVAEESFLSPGRCQEAADKIDSLIVQSQECAADEDCVWEFFGCPWGCGTPLIAGKLASIRKAIEESTTGCGPCKYKCSKRDFPPNPACRKGRCVDLNLDRVK